MIDYSEPQLISLQNFADARGSLGVVEAQNLPFDINRFYYLFDVPIGAVRGEHGHKELQQLLICLNGACKVTLNDGTKQFHFDIDSPVVGLYVPPGMWRSLQFRMANTVVGVLASRPYEEKDYIYSFEEFRTWAQSHKP